jgi:cellulose synthase/poly-beta-1,6-N-acetylglucosamine synthase-like glycosyltransferase
MSPAGTGHFPCDICQRTVLLTVASVTQPNPPPITLPDGTALQRASADKLADNFAANSPRLAPPRLPLVSALIHGGVLLVWVALFSAAFAQAGSSGLWAWAVGVAYVLYDTVLLLFVAWQTRPLWQAQPRPPTALPGAQCSLAVIIAAHDEAQVLPQTLAALWAQTDRPQQIVIADDGSTDATAELLTSRYGLHAPAPGALSAESDLHPGLHWLRLPHGGKARALNAALLCVNTELVLTVDGDTLLEAGAVAAMRQAFAAEPALVAATGVIVPFCGRGAVGRCFEWFQTYEYIRNFLSRYAWMRVDGLLLISGAFAGFRLAALRAVGGFDRESLVEDYELIHRLHRHARGRGLDWRVRVIGQAIAQTEAPGSLMPFLRQRRRWFGGFLQTQYWYRDMVGDRRLGALGLMMLPVKAIDTLQPLYGLAAFGLLLSFIVRGQLGVLAPVAGVIAAKIVLDLVFHLGSVQLYRRWVGRQLGVPAKMGEALLAALVEPFSFQLLRHSGAAWGWWAFLSGRSGWGRQVRQGMDQRAR